jgi:cation:H+ antiporter
MLLDVGILIAGLVILSLGAEWLVRGAASVAISVGMRPLIVGLTVVALGTSFPEFVELMMGLGGLDDDGAATASYFKKRLIFGGGTPSIHRRI